MITYSDSLFVRLVDFTLYVSNLKLGRCTDAVDDEVIKTPFKDGCLDFVDKTFLLVVIFNAIFGVLSLGVTLMHAVRPKLLSRLRLPTVQVQT